MIPATQEEDPLNSRVRVVHSIVRGGNFCLLRDGTEVEVGRVHGVRASVDDEGDRAELGVARVGVEAISNSGAGRLGTGDLWDRVRFNIEVERMSEVDSPWRRGP